MQHWGMLELYLGLLMMQLQDQRSKPLAPTAPSRWSVWRRRLAHELIDVGLRLDSDATRAALGTATAQRLKGSDA